MTKWKITLVHLKRDEDGEPTGEEVGVDQFYDDEETAAAFKRSAEAHSSADRVDGPVKA